MSSVAPALAATLTWVHYSHAGAAQWRWPLGSTRPAGTERAGVETVLLCLVIVIVIVIAIVIVIVIVFVIAIVIVIVIVFVIVDLELVA